MFAHDQAIGLIGVQPEAMPAAVVAARCVVDIKVHPESETPLQLAGEDAPGRAEVLDAADHHCRITAVERRNAVLSRGALPLQHPIRASACCDWNGVGRAAPQLMDRERTWTFLITKLTALSVYARLADL